MPAEGASSTRLFHSLQASHLPCQREATAPQLWQMKDVRGLAKERIPIFDENNYRT